MIYPCMDRRQNMGTIVEGREAQRAPTLAAVVDEAEVEVALPSEATVVDYSTRS